MVDTVPPPAYQRFATKAMHLSHLGLSCLAIGMQLNTSDKTVAKAIAWGEAVRGKVHLPPEP